MLKLTAYFTHPVRFTALVFGFCILGVLLIYNVSVAESLTTFGHPWFYAFNQLKWFMLGIIVYAITFHIPLDWWKALSPVIFLGTIVLLILVLIPGIGEEALGAQRRIVLGPIRIQPAEITKLAVIIFFASWLEKHQRFAPFVFLTGVIFGLILLQPHLSTATIVAAIATLLYFLAGGNMKMLTIFGSFAALIVFLLIIAAPYRRDRLTTFLNPSSDPLGKSYHIHQITIALGRGGWLGQGIGMSKQKQQYVPETSTDSLFAIYAEETGFIGSVGIILAYMLLVGVCYTVALQQADTFSFLIAAGVGSWIGIHSILNIAAMVALIPLTGIPLPLLSSGGSSLLSILAGLGVVAHLTQTQTNSQKKLFKWKRPIRKRKR